MRLTQHSSSAKIANISDDEARRDVACASLRQVGMFSTLPHAALCHLAEAALFRKVESREMLLAAGAAPEYIHFLIHGAGKVSRTDVSGREILLYLVKPGEVFGAPISGTQNIDDSTMVVALEPSIVGRVPSQQVESLLGETGYLGAVQHITSHRLRQVETRLDEMTTGPVPSRIARVLLRLCDEFPKSLDCGTKVDVLLTQQDLAGIVGSTREVINATLGVFRHEGWLDIHGRYICIHQRNELCELAHY